MKSEHEIFVARMTVAEYLSQTEGHIRPRVTCADGFHVSIQASDTHYCSPRNDEGPWHSVELGFPSAADDLIQEYAEDPDHPTDTVYGYVPLAVVEALVSKHGGLTLDKTAR